MPFTFSHPVFVFPLKRLSPKYVSFTGLVLGSMAPDFEYFLMLEPYRSIGHSLMGLLVQAIPLSIGFAFLFHNIVKKPMALHLPSICQLDRRAYGMLGEWKLRTVRDWTVFLFSVVIGFISHVFVDAFTHAGGFFVMHLPFLQQAAIGRFPLYKILQYGFSVLGLLAAAGGIAYGLYRSQGALDILPQVTRPQKVMYWAVCIAVAFLVTAAKLAGSASGNHLGVLVVAPISGLMLGIFLSSLIIQLRGILQQQK